MDLRRPMGLMYRTVVHHHHSNSNTRHLLALRLQFPRIMLQRMAHIRIRTIAKTTIRSRISTKIDNGMRCPMPIQIVNHNDFFFPCFSLSIFLPLGDKD
jgi:hypothetical protein